MAEGAAVVVRCRCCRGCRRLIAPMMSIADGLPEEHGVNILLVNIAREIMWTARRILI